MKTDVYSWRLTQERKAALEGVAEREGKTVADLLVEATDGLLVARDSVDEGDQAHLRARVLRHVGAFDSSPGDAAKSRDVIRDRLQAKRRQGRL